MIQMPGIIFEVASVNGRGKPYQLVSLAYSDPQTYLRQTVEPLIKQGVTQVFMHRMFGETVPGDRPMEYDSFVAMDEEKGSQEKTYVRKMLKSLNDLMWKYPLVQPVIYIGSMGDASMFDSETMGDTKEWARRIWSAVQVFENLNWPVAPKFVFDAVARPLDNPDAHATEQQWAAFCMVGSMLGWHRVSMEALPHPNRPDQYGTPAFVWDKDWQSTTKEPVGSWTRTPEMLGDVTRVLTGHGWDYWAYREYDGMSGVALWLLDCHARGHPCFVSPGVLDILAGITLEEAVDQANRFLLDEKDAAK